MKLHGLYIVTPDWDDTTQLLDATEQAIRGGATIVQYRHKTASAELRRTQATQLLRLCRDFNVPFIINDHVDLCIELNADGVHVGGTDASVKQVRQQLGLRKIIGASCYGDIELARAAAQDGASYIALGGLYPSKVKKYAINTPPALITQVKAAFNLPIVVIGGMTADNCAVLIEQGADMVAAISSVYASDAPKKAAQTMSGLF